MSSTQMDKRVDKPVKILFYWDWTMPLSSSYLLQVPFLLQTPGFSSSSPATVITNTKPVALGSRHILFSLLEILKSSLELSAAASRPACIYLLGSVRRVHTYTWLLAQPGNPYLLTGGFEAIYRLSASKGDRCQHHSHWEKTKGIILWDMCYTGPSQLFPTALNTAPKSKEEGNIKKKMK